MAIAGIIVSVGSPVVATLLLPLIITKGRANGTSIILCALPAALFFSLINYSKAPQSDWRWFVTHYEFLRVNGFSQYMTLAERSDIVLVGVRPQASEPLSYILSYLISFVAGDNYQLLGLILSLIFYICIGVAIALIGKSLRSERAIPLAVFVTIFISITPTLVLHLLRQELSMALVLLGMATLLVGSRIASLVIFMAAVLTHNSAVFPIVVFLASYLAFRSSFPKYARLPIVLGASVVALYILSLSPRVDLVKNDGDVNIAIYAIDVLICIVALVSSRAQKSPVGEIISLSGLSYCLSILFISGIDLLFLRLSFFIEAYRGIIVALLIYLNWDRKWFGYTYLFFVPIALIYPMLRYQTSPFEFSLPYLKLLLWPW